MKKLLVLVAFLTCLMGSAMAVPFGHVAKIRDPDPVGSTYSATVKYTTWGTNGSGQYTSTVNYLTLTGTTMAYCQQQLNSVMASPGVTVVQFCHIN